MLRVRPAGALLALLVLAQPRAAPAEGPSVPSVPSVPAPSEEGDFAFDVSDELQNELLHKSDKEPDCSVKRLWGVPDMTAYVGHMFSLRIPKEAFSGKVTGYKVTGVEGSLPSWLTLDSHKGLLRGLPTAENRGEHRILVTALAAHKKHCSPPTDVFTIQVKDKREASAMNTVVEESCRVGEDESRLIILIGKPFQQITLKQRLNAITQLANFMGLSYSSFLIQPHQANPETGSGHDIVLMAGHGDIKKKHLKSSSEIELTVGCSGSVWSKHSILVHQIKDQVRDGSISFVINLPVTGWKLVKHGHVPLIRKQRQIPEGSAYDEDDEMEEDEDYAGADYSGADDYEESRDTRPEVYPATPPEPPMPPPPTAPLPSHPHRHHHGEPTTEQTSPPPPPPTSPPPPIVVTTVAVPEPTAPPTQPPTSTETPQLVEFEPEAETDEPEITSLFETAPPSETVPPSTPITYPAPPAPPAPEPPEDTTLLATTTNANAVQTTDKRLEIVPIAGTSTNKDEEITEKSIERHAISEDFAPSIVPAYTSSTERIAKEYSGGTFELPITPSISTTPQPRQEDVNSPFDEEFDYPTSELPRESSSFNEILESTARETTPVDPTSTERSSTIIGRTTEIIHFDLPTNTPPKKQHRTKKVPVTEGKAFSYIIPEDVFIDAEDGTNLKLQMYDMEHVPLKSTSWVQFNPETREVYGLPLEDNVSKWEYLIEATDSKGESVTDTLDITVQQHKGRRAFNHEFSMKLRILKKYPAGVDWQIRALKGLVNLFRDTDMDQITVRGVNLTADPVEFFWSNDTLPKNYCAKSDIDRLMGILQSNAEGDPSDALVNVMSPDLRIKSVGWSGTNDCQPPRPEPTEDPKHPDNFSPMPRNQIDHINATAGKLLIFKVPDDTFYDPEDGSARNLKMWLTKGDRSPLSPHNWLQFDTKNQEFYGVPLEKDIGRKDYQLVCEDSGKLTANDGLLVEVHPSPPMRPTTEFTMTIVTQYDTFVQSASLKRKFIEKLSQLFNDKDTSSIKIKSISEGPTLISWYNVSLPTDRCPKEEINQLRKILVREDKIMTERVDVVMGDFEVSAFGLIERGACATAGPIIRTAEIPPILTGPSEETSQTVDSDDYLLTFIIPIVVIVCMIIIAALIACILYKRRRSGKMSVGDDEERQAFRSKGIPVIFQDELDEKPDPCNKSPVIMKEEKPPLLPPPEYKAGDSGSPTPSHAPYHPPPPFTARDAPRNSRPKPSPSYRKPPPYVPP